MPHNVAMVHNDDWFLYRFRSPLLRKLKSRGCTVFAVAPAGRAVSAFEQEEIGFIDWPLSRGSLNPFTEILRVLTLWRIYRKTKTQLAQHFTVKPNIYGPIAARLAGVPVILSSVEGLGYLFTSKDFKAALIRPIVTALYRLAFALTDAVVFQNRDDISVLRGLGLLPQSKVRHIPGGVGVNTTVFSPEAVDADTKRKLRRSIGLPDSGLIVVLAARMLWHKGVAEFVECARVLTQKKDTHFLLVGPIDTGNPAAIPIETLHEWDQTGIITYLGEREDIRDILALSDLLLLPSFYREGTPTILVEGAAMGKPIVTTDFPGCREVVEHGVNGLLVPPNDTLALTCAVEKLLDSPKLRGQFADAGRRRAVAEFDESKINARFMELYNTLLVQKGLQALPEEM